MSTNIRNLPLSLLLLACFASSGCDRTESDWNKAKETNSPAAYSNFLAKHPQGPHVDDAIKAIDDIDWKLARSTATIAACEVYLSDHEKGKYLVDALDLKAALDERSSSKPRFMRTSSMTYSEVHGEGWEPPTERVYFGGQGGGALLVMTAGATATCPLVCQDVVYVLDEGGHRGKRVPVSMYKGCPIVLGDELSVQRGVEIRVETQIVVTDAKAGVLVVDTESLVPFGANNVGNVVWVFGKKGMSFSTKTKHYLTEKVGATIRFSKDGITTDGIRILSRGMPTSLPATTRSES